MTFLSALVGGTLGFSMQLYSNAIRKLPYFRRACSFRFFPGALVSLLISLILATPISFPRRSMGARALG